MQLKKAYIGILTCTFVNVRLVKTGIIEFLSLAMMNYPQYGMYECYLLLKVHLGLPPYQYTGRYYNLSKVGVRTSRIIT